MESKFIVYDNKHVLQKTPRLCKQTPEGIYIQIQSNYEIPNSINTYYEIPNSINTNTVLPIEVSYF